MQLISHYLRKFSHLKTAKVKGNSAPHKPILLLSIIQNIEQNHIITNHIYITPTLVATFKDIWSALVHNPTFTANFSLPFYHLKSEGFWHIHTHPGKEILLTSSHSIKSFANLQDAVWYASLDEDLFVLLQQTDTCEALKHTLLQTYFKGTSNNNLLTESPTLYTITQQILNEAPAIYKQQIATADEEEIFIRNGVFKKTIPTIYNHTCCITGMQIISTHNIQMIDACHIVPFSISHNDTITNGISLCPNFHRAFDRGLITIIENYTIAVSTTFTEKNTNHSLHQFVGKQIALPKEENYHPNKDNLRWHQENIFKH